MNRVDEALKKEIPPETIFSDFNYTSYGTIKQVFYSVFFIVDTIKMCYSRLSSKMTGN